MSYKVLIVEDAKIIALHLKQILEKAGYEVTAMATNKKEALSAVKAQNPDIILMDIMLSNDDDGIDTIKEIQKTKEIPFIYLTALTDRSTVLRAKETKPYGYIMKPFQAEQVVTLMEMALHKYTTETKLQESEQKFKAAVSSITDCFIFLDNEFKINYINPTAEKLIECSMEDCKGHNFFDFFSFKDLTTGEPVTNLWTQGPEAKSASIDALYLISKSGEEKPVGDGVINKVFGPDDTLKGVVITFRDISEKLRKINLKQEADKKQMTAMIEGQEQERLRIARELHDGLGQLLNAIKLQVNNNGIDAELKLAQMSELITEAIQETSRISENLLPSKLKNFDLVPCLESLTHDKYSKLEIKLDSTGVKNNRIDINKKVNLYRITQELITNCQKHAQANYLSIQLRGEGSRLVLTVEDDGKGFDFSKQKENLLAGHMGLQNILDRVKIMDGKIEIDSKPNLGSLTIIEVPY